MYKQNEGIVNDRCISTTPVSYWHLQVSIGAEYIKSDSFTGGYECL